MLNWELPEGRWKAIPNANANISGAKVFSDDNIVGEIKITTSDITTYYNSARAQYIEKNHNSVKEDIIVYTPQQQLNTNETKHKMELSYPLCDSASEAQRKADVELKQNRLDKVVSFTSDYTGLGVEPGDIIKVTNSDYGFSEKTFRVVRVRETMDDDILMLNITAIEWSNETYNDRIPFRKPALDDIEFEPEEYSDIIDGGAVRTGSVPGTAITDGSIDGGANVTGNYEYGGGPIANASISSLKLENGGASIASYMGNVAVGTLNANVSLPVKKFPLTESDIGTWTLIAEAHYDYIYQGPVVTSGQQRTILYYDVTVNYASGSSTTYSAVHNDGAFTTLPMHQHLTLNYTVNTGASNVEIKATGVLDLTQAHNASTRTFDSGFISVLSRDPI